MSKVVVHDTVSVDDLKKYVSLNTFYADEINRLIDLFKKRGILSVVTSTRLYSLIPFYIEKHEELCKKVNEEEFTKKVLDDLAYINDRLDTIQDDLHEKLRVHY